MLFDMKFNLVTDVNGDVTVVAGVGSGPWFPGLCYVEMIILDFGNLDVNMDISITTVAHGVVVTHFTKTDQAAADAVWFPMTLGHDAADASQLAVGDGNAYKRIVLDGPPSVVLADGGNVQTGQLYIIVDVPTN